MPEGPAEGSENVSRAGPETSTYRTRRVVSISSSSVKHYMEARMSARSRYFLGPHIGARTCFLAIPVDYGSHRLWMRGVHIE